MKILTIVISCVTLFFFTNKLFSQSKVYEKGYMITLENDTIQGFIKEDKRDVLAYQFLFKKTIDGRAKTISPSEAIGFYFEPSFYFNRILIKTGRGKEEYQFIRKLMDGYTNLYQIVNGIELEYVLIKENGEQLHIAQNDVVDGGSYKVDTKYFGALKHFLKDCEEIMKIKSIRYNEKSIANLVAQYNNCKAPNSISKSLGQGRKLTVKPGLTVGFRRYNMKISDLQPPNQKYEGKGADLRFGVLFSLGYFRKLSLQTGIIYNQYATEGQYTYSLGFGQLSHKFSNLDVPILLRYNFSTKKVTPYFIGGIHLGKLLKGKSSELKIEVGTTVIDEEYDLVLNNIVTYAGGFGVAIQFGKSTRLNLDLMYNRTITHIRVLPDTTVDGIVLSSSIFF